jgi:hypothetical protein
MAFDRKQADFWHQLQIELQATKDEFGPDEFAQWTGLTRKQSANTMLGIRPLMLDDARMIMRNAPESIGDAVGSLLVEGTGKRSITKARFEREKAKVGKVAHPPKQYSTEEEEKSPITIIAGKLKIDAFDCRAGDDFVLWCDLGIARGTAEPLLAFMACEPATQSNLPIEEYFEAPLFVVYTEDFFPHRRGWGNRQRALYWIKKMNEFMVRYKAMFDLNPHRGPDWYRISRAFMRLRARPDLGVEMLRTFISIGHAVGTNRFKLCPASPSSAANGESKQIHTPSVHKPIYMNVGSSRIVVRITHDPLFDDKKKPAHAVADQDAATIWISAKLSRGDRLQKLLHEAHHFHEWVYGPPRDDEEPRCQRAEAVFIQVWSDLEKQGGLEALMALGPESSESPA